MAKELWVSTTTTTTTTTTARFDEQRIEYS
jgi:hypothetical protein